MAAVTLVYSCDRDIIDDTKQENGKDVIKDIELVEADDLVKFGGALNCASWTTTERAIIGIHYSRSANK